MKETHANNRTEYANQREFDRALFFRKKKDRTLPKDKITPWQDLYMKLREEERLGMDEHREKFRTFHM